MAELIETGLVYPGYCGGAEDDQHLHRRGLYWYNRRLVVCSITACGGPTQIGTRGLRGERTPVSNAYDITTYGERMAEVYDQWPGLPQNTDAIVACLIRLAGAGPILELGIGTGRIALPLARHGFIVHGIDASPAMVAQLRAKPGGEHIPVTIGNFADMAVEGRFTLIFVVFNTFFGLLSQDDQVRCFLGVAQHLADDGVFVLEAFVPDLGRYDRGQRVGAVEVETDRVRLEASLHDPVQQRVMSQQVVLSEQGIRLYPVQARYAWPSELDLMARLAGLKLRERWAGWAQEPFTAASGSHVSVFARAT